METIALVLVLASGLVGGADYRPALLIIISPHLYLHKRSSCVVVEGLSGRWGPQVALNWSGHSFLLYLIFIHKEFIVLRYGSPYKA